MNLGAAHVRLSTILLSMAVLSSRRGGGDCKTYNEVKYDFRYSVDEPSSGVVMDQWEDRSGEFVKGGYSMLDADGKIRTVHYEVDGKKGFQAIVNRKYPSTILLVNHLLYPKKYRAPYQHAKPVSLITRDLFDTKVRPYPNLPDT
ncbi:uncharacterized protein CBL_05735 [Carabus blaptoides fortunei]